MPLNDGYAYREQLGADAAGRRLLAYLVKRYRHSSEATWQARLARGEVWLNGKVARGDEELPAGALLIWNRPPWQEEDVPRSYDLVYADDALLAVNKPSGLPTLHGGGFLQNTLQAALRDRFPGASALHRLGRGTSGLVLFARTGEAASVLLRAWRDHEVEKRYRALASGVAEHGEYDIEVPIGPVFHPRLGSVHAASAGGKAARSVARVLQRRERATLFQVDIHTGRPHQIRIHLASIGHPLVGDELYAPGGGVCGERPALPGDGGYLLHAERLVFAHPLSGERLELHAPAPAELACR